MYALTLAGLTLVAAAQDCSVPLLNPACAIAAPASFNVTFKTLAGNIDIAVVRANSPLGADRFYSLAKFGYFSSEVANDNNAGFFRVVPAFVTQFGISGNTTVSGAWANAQIANDPVILSNVFGTIAYAAEQDASGNACCRTTQVYINFGDNSRLDALGFTPFGTISAAGMAVAAKIYSGYGETPDQDSIYSQGDAYLRASYPKLSYITGTTVVDTA